MSVTEAFLAAPLYGWGQNTAGQLGNGGTANVTEPIELTGRKWVWVSRSKSGSASVGIAEDGGLYVWGTCTKVGALGVSGVTSVATPTLIDPGPWKKAVYAKNHGIGVKEDGTLWGWGHPYMGALGVGTADVPAIVTPFVIDQGLWVDVAVIDYSTYDRVSLAVKADGTLWSCGYGAGTGQGSATTAYGTLTQIPNQANVMAVDAAWGPVAGALKTSGDMLVWGAGNNGHRGAGSQGSSPSPVAVPGTWADFALSETHVLALNTSGEVWGWGGNLNGQLGLGSTGNAVLPSVVPIAGTFVSIAAGAGCSIIIRDDGAMFSAGSDNVGQLGNGGTNSNTSSFAQIGAANAPWRMASSGLSSYAVQFVAAPPSLPTVESSASVGSMLGDPSVVSTSVPAAFAASGRILSDPAVRAVMGGRAHASAPTMLADAGATVNHDFTVALGDVTARYLMDLVTPSGLVRAPISSWQATLQTGGKCYVQAVVPASTQYADAINAASEFVISRAAVLPSGMQIEQEMARAPVSAQFDRGSMRETCTISGYADAFAASENPSSEYDRTLSRIRSMSSGAGGMRVRCAVDWLLRPGQRAFANGVPMIADYINYYAPTGGDSYMDVGERA